MISLQFSYILVPEVQTTPLDCELHTLIHTSPFENELLYFGLTKNVWSFGSAFFCAEIWLQRILSPEIGLFRDLRGHYYNSVLASIQALLRHLGHLGIFRAICGKLLTRCLPSNPFDGLGCRW